MIILDTHAWVWCVSQPKLLSSRARGSIEQARRVGICAISCWEVAMLVAHGRIGLDRPLEEWLEEALSPPTFELCALSPKVAVMSTQLKPFHGDPADRLIVATAQFFDANLVTKDTKIRRAGRCPTIWS